MHDLESARVPRGQLSLFTRPTVAEVLVRRGVGIHVARQLYYDGHLSFEPAPDRRLQSADEAELDFLCAVSALVGTRQIDRILGTLRAPYAYHLERLTFDFATRAWRLVDPAPEAWADLAPTG